MRDEREMKWKTLASVRLVDRPWLKARRDTVQLPGGRVYDEYYVLSYPAWINVIAETEEGQIVLERQYRHGLGVVSTEICAGVVEAGETPLQAARRELEEETGYKVASPDELEFLIRIDTMVAFGDEEIDIFVARNLIKSEQHLDEDESIDVEEWALEDLVDLIYKGELKDSKTVAAIIAYKSKYNL